MANDSFKARNGRRFNGYGRPETLTVHKLIGTALTGTPIHPDAREIYKLRTEDSRKYIVEAIVKKFMLNSHTKVETKYEFVFKDAFIYHNLPVLYTPFSLFVNSKHKQKNGGNITSYLPDYVMPFHYIKGNNIAIEPHCSELMTKAYLKKLNEVRNKYGFYIVLATTPDFKENGNLGMARQYVNDVWIIRNCLVKGCVEELNMKMRNLMDKAERRENMPLDNIMELLRKSREVQRTRRRH